MDMLNFSRSDRPTDTKDAGKPTTKLAPYGTGALQANAGSPMPPRAPSAATVPPPRDPPAAQAKEPAQEAVPEAPSTEASGSKLIVGNNVKLKGVEISNCDVLLIEGQVEATVNSKAMEIARPGTLTGTAHIDVAEIHGEFSGELTARTKLVVHGTGRVTGTIRYGKLVVAEGGMLTGDLRQIDAPAVERSESASEARTKPSPPPDMRSLLNPQH
jgi:cytoskeletal protein CcmA (bactofilin family)